MMMRCIYIKQVKCCSWEHKLFNLLYFLAELSLCWNCTLFDCLSLHYSAIYWHQVGVIGGIYYHKYHTFHLKNGNAQDGMQPTTVSLTHLIHLSIPMTILHASPQLFICVYNHTMAIAGHRINSIAYTDVNAQNRK